MHTGIEPAFIRDHLEAPNVEKWREKALILGKIKRPLSLENDNPSSNPG